MSASHLASGLRTLCLLLAVYCCIMLPLPLTALASCFRISLWLPLHLTLAASHCAYSLQWLHRIVPTPRCHCISLPLHLTVPTLRCIRLSLYAPTQLACGAGGIIDYEEFFVRSLYRDSGQALQRAEHENSKRNQEAETTERRTQQEKSIPTVQNACCLQCALRDSSERKE